MNKSIFRIMSAFILQATFICGCSPGEEESAPQEPEEPEKVLSASPLTLSFKAEGESCTIVVASNATWKLTHKTQTESWCLPNKTTGSGNADIQMTATPNPIEEERTDTYTLSIEGKELTIHLLQEGADLRIPLLFSSSSEVFAEGDQIGLFMVNRPSGSNTPAQMNSFKGNQADNIKITKQSGSLWVATGDIFWKNPTTVVDAYAYYPWRQATLNDSPTSWLINVEKDQSSQAGFLASARPKYGQALNRLPYESGNLDISFAPVMAKLNIEIRLIDGADQVFQMEKSQISAIYIEGKLNLNTGQVQTTGRKSEVNTLLGKDGDGNTISQFYLIPQTCEPGEFLTLTYIDKRYDETVEIPITIDETYQFEAGKVYNFVISLSKTTDRLTLENVSISGWDKGEEIEFPFN